VTRVVFRMQLHIGAEHFGNVVNRGITAAIEAVLKRAYYISEMSQNYVCSILLERRRVALMFCNLY
jgi:hypothetical protein